VRGGGGLQLPEILVEMGGFCEQEVKKSLLVVCVREDTVGDKTLS
jgi:hypothetical protein